MKDWADIIIRFRESKENNNNTVLVADNYYAMNASRSYLNDNDIHFIMAYLDVHGDTLLLAGSSAAITRKVPNSNRKEILVHHWDSTARIGKKYVLGNCFTQCRPSRDENHIVPGYHHYQKMFNICDAFNRQLKDRKYGHRCGGKQKSGQEGHVHKFLMASLLQNIFNAYKTINNDFTKDFQTMCIELSDEIYAYSQQFIEFKD